MKYSFVAMLIVTEMRRKRARERESDRRKEEAVLRVNLYNHGVLCDLYERCAHLNR